MRRPVHCLLHLFCDGSSAGLRRPSPNRVARAWLAPGTPSSSRRFLVEPSPPWVCSPIGVRSSTTSPQLNLDSRRGFWREMCSTHLRRTSFELTYVATRFQGGRLVRRDEVYRLFAVRGAPGPIEGAYMGYALHVRKAGAMCRSSSPGPTLRVHQFSDDDGVEVRKSGRWPSPTRSALGGSYARRMLSQ